MNRIRHFAIHPQNAISLDKIRFVPYFKELQLSWTANDPMSLGMEKFVDEYLPVIRYLWDRKRAMRCCFKPENQILSFVEEMSIGGDFRPGKKRGIRTHLPRGQELWNTETRGHDVFKVYSKWKADPPDPNEITSEKHPNFIQRKVIVKGSRF